MAIKKDIFLKQLGEHIRDVRLKKNITQFDLASNIGKDRQSVQRVESGDINASVYYLYELAEGLDISLEELLAFKIAPKKKIGFIIL
ncbi:MAG TPA: helix-turn-helix transcriptional regulator [Bacteroidia bacterium]|nr:helix-turn-helix transcriptional regulator [Bacteroidia bacterium]